MFRYNLTELQSKAIDLANCAEPPLAILLSGPVGSGKTTFSQFFIKSLLVDKNQSVTSPTFNIVQIYDSIKGNIWHADLYRVKSQEELFELGLIEACFDSICLIEWPDILLPFISDSNIIIVDLSVVSI